MDWIAMPQNVGTTKVNISWFGICRRTLKLPRKLKRNAQFTADFCASNADLSLADLKYVPFRVHRTSLLAN